MVGFKSAAVIVWMPEDEKPSIKSFETDDNKMPAIEGCWELGIALVKAVIGPLGRERMRGQKWAMWFSHPTTVSEPTSASRTLSLSMLKGLHGEKRPADAVDRAEHVAKIDTPVPKARSPHKKREGA